MSLYDEFSPLAVEMLDEFGAPAQLVRTSPASMVYDPITDRTVEQSNNETLTVQAVVGEMEWADDQGRTTTRATVITTVQPVQGDTLKQGEMTYRVGRVRQIAPQGQPIIFMAQVD